MVVLTKDSVVMVTGGASGIGEAIVNHFLTRECQVIIVDTKLGNSAQTIYHHGPKRCAFFQCDVTDELAVSELFIEIMAKYTKLDFLINTAAFNKSNWDSSLLPASKMVKYACIMMSRKRPVVRTRNTTPSHVIVVDITSGLDKGLEDAIQTNMCPVFFQQGIRLVTVPLNVFTDTIPQDQIKEIAYAIFKLSICDKKQTSFLELSPIGPPSL